MDGDKRLGSCGFTLIELLGAIFTFTLGLYALLFAMTQGLSSLRENRWSFLAQAAAVRQMESLRNQAFAGIAALPPASPFPDLNGDGIGDGLESIPQAVGMVYVQNYNGSSDIKQVTVKVTAGAGRAWRLVTLVSRSQ